MNTYEIYRAVERLGELMKVSTRQLGAEFGLQPVQLEVLHYLTLCNRYSDNVMAVAEYLGQTKGTISQTVKVLEQKGFIEKVPDSKDKRASHLQVTDKGRELITDKLPDRQFQQAIAALSDNKQETLLLSLNDLVSALIQSNKINTFGVCKTCKYNVRREEKYHCTLLNVELKSPEVEKLCREHTE